MPKTTDIETVTTSKAVVMAEYRLLNALAKNADFFQDPDVSESLFVHEVPKSIYQAIISLTEMAVPITENALFQQAESIDINVTPEIIAQVFKIESEPIETVKDITVLLRRSRKRLDAMEKLTNAREFLSDAHEEDIDAIQQVIRDAQEIIDNIDKNDREVMRFAEWFDMYLEDFEARRTGKQHPFIDPILDAAVPRGMQGGDIITIASSSGQGKSSHCLNLINNFINSYVPTMYFSPEMGGIDTMDRLMSIRKGIPFSEIVAPTNETYASLHDAIMQERDELLKNEYFRFSQEASLSLESIRSEIIKFKQETGHDFVVVFIDLLTMVKEFCETRIGMNMPQTIEVAMNQLSRIAKELGVCVFGVVQIGRKADSTKVTCVDDIDMLRPSRNDIKNANAILERSRVVYSLFRKAFYAEMYLNPEDEDVKALIENDIVEINFLKLSNSKVGRRYSLFTPETFTMIPMLDTDNEGKE
jgi:replicative DNA helicase